MNINKSDFIQIPILMKEDFLNKQNLILEVVDILNSKEQLYEINANSSTEDKLDFYGLGKFNLYNKTNIINLETITHLKINENEIRLYVEDFNYYIDIEIIQYENSPNVELVKIINSNIPIYYLTNLCNETKIYRNIKKIGIETNN